MTGAGVFAMVPSSRWWRWCAVWRGTRRGRGCAQPPGMRCCVHTPQRKMDGSWRPSKWDRLVGEVFVVAFLFLLKRTKEKILLYFVVSCESSNDKFYLSCICPSVNNLVGGCGLFALWKQLMNLGDLSKVYHFRVGRSTQISKVLWGKAARTTRHPLEAASPQDFQTSTFHPCHHQWTCRCRGWLTHHGTRHRSSLRCRTELRRGIRSELPWSEFVLWHFVAAVVMWHVSGWSCVVALCDRLMLCCVSVRQTDAVLWHCATHWSCFVALGDWLIVCCDCGNRLILCCDTVRQTDSVLWHSATVWFCDTATLCDRLILFCDTVWQTDSVLWHCVTGWSCFVTLCDRPILCCNIVQQTDPVLWHCVTGWSCVLALCVVTVCDRLILFHDSVWQTDPVLWHCVTDWSCVVTLWQADPVLWHCTLIDWSCVMALCDWLWLFLCHTVAGVMMYHCVVGVTMWHCGWCHVVTLCSGFLLWLMSCCDTMWLADPILWHCVILWTLLWLVLWCWHFWAGVMLWHFGCQNVRCFAWCLVVVFTCLYLVLRV